MNSVALHALILWPPFTRLLKQSSNNTLLIEKQKIQEIIFNSHKGNEWCTIHLRNAKWYGFEYYTISDVRKIESKRRNSETLVVQGWKDFFSPTLLRIENTLRFKTIQQETKKILRWSNTKYKWRNLQEIILNKRKHSSANS